MAENKNHWYDGQFYDRIIAPNQDQLFAQVKDLIDPHSTVIDVGCGTGRLAFALGNHCESVLGIDLSKRNIDRAHLLLRRRPNEKISFKHLNVGETRKRGDKPFDYAILTYVIHEVDEEDRINLLNEIFLIADQLIIGDYRYPKPTGLSGFISETIEYLAGKEHYRNYRSYMAAGGINSLVNESGLRIIKEVKNHRSVDQIVILSR